MKTLKSPSKKLSILYRKNIKGFYSIEKLVRLLENNSFEFTRSVTLIELPFSNRGILNKILNIFYTSYLSLVGDVHLYGDCTYCALFAFNTNKLYLTIHDIFFLKRHAGIKKFLIKKLLLQYPIQKAYKVHSISQHTKDDILKEFPTVGKKIIVIPNPIILSSSISNQQDKINSSCYSVQKCFKFCL